MLNIENLSNKFAEVVESKEWKELQKKYNMCDDIYVLGHGGNMGIADHTAVDMTRLSNGTKNAICPGSCVVATSLINDTNFDQWMVSWLQQRTCKSRDVNKALQWASENGMKACLVTSYPTEEELKGVTQVVLGVKYYHTAEVLTLLLQYQLTHGSGKECPPIGKNSPTDLEEMNWQGGKIRKYSYPDETVNIAIDFDGVIHKCSKGYYDGTIYDDPVHGVAGSLKEISKKYSIIVHTCKAKADRGLVNGKTGTQLVWEWLSKHDLSQYISKVTSEKPRAVCYIDDKSIEFRQWEDCISSLREREIL